MNTTTINMFESQRTGRSFVPVDSYSCEFAIGMQMMRTKTFDNHQMRATIKTRLNNGQDVTINNIPGNSDYVNIYMPDNTQQYDELDEFQTDIYSYTNVPFSIAMALFEDKTLYTLLTYGYYM